VLGIRKYRKKKSEDVLKEPREPHKRKRRLKREMTTRAKWPVSKNCCQKDKQCGKRRDEGGEESKEKID